MMRFIDNFLGSRKLRYNKFDFSSATVHFFFNEIGDFFCVENVQRLRMSQTDNVFQ